MKKCKLIAIAVLIIVTITSCYKEGVYLPEKKIVAVSVATTTKIVQNYGQRSESTPVTVGPFRTEDWHWGKKLLESIDFLDTLGNIVEQANFKYKGKHIVRIDNMSGDCYSEFTYDGKFYEKKVIGKIEWHKNGEVVTTVELVRNDDGIVTQVEVTNTKDIANDVIIKGILSMVIPEPLIVEDIVCQNGLKGSGQSVTTVKFTWTGNNITQMDQETSGGSSRTYTYTFDNKINPTKGLYEFSDGWGFDMLNENNKLTSTYMYHDKSYTTTYEYDYVEDWPIMKTIKYTRVINEYIEAQCIDKVDYNYAIEE